MPSLTIAKIRAMDSGKGSAAPLPAAEEETTEASPAIAVGTKVLTLRLQTCGSPLAALHRLMP